jgi:hypothetical protein
MSRLIAIMLCATVLAACQMPGKGYSGASSTSATGSSGATGVQARPGDPPPEMKASQSE